MPPTEYRSRHEHPVTVQPVSLAKTTRPSLAGIIPRDRLFGRLDEALGSSVIWVTGPPGCGKTTLAASYLEHRKLPSLWYQLDEGDADVASFFYYLGLATADPGRRKPARVPQLTPEYHAGLPAFTRRYFQALFQQLGPSFAIPRTERTLPFEPIDLSARGARLRAGRKRTRTFSGQHSTAATRTSRTTSRCTRPDSMTRPKSGFPAKSSTPGSAWHCQATRWNRRSSPAPDIFWTFRARFDLHAEEKATEWMGEHPRPSMAEMRQPELNVWAALDTLATFLPSSRELTALRRQPSSYYYRFVTPPAKAPGHCPRQTD